MELKDFLVQRPQVSELPNRSFFFFLSPLLCFDITQSIPRWSRDNVDSIATNVWTIEGSGFKSRRGKDIYLLPILSKSALGPTQ
jgi:hypothetical protein